MFDCMYNPFLQVRVVRRRVRCSRRKWSKLVRRCNLRKGASIYHVYRVSRLVVRACRCKIRHRYVRILCRCIRGRYIKKCAAGRKILIRIYYRRFRNRCVKRKKVITTRVVCSRRVYARVLGCRRCRRSISLTFWRRVNCRCYRRTTLVPQRCCCPNNKMGLRYRGCVRGQKIYSKIRYVLRATRRFRVRINGRMYVRIMRCRPVTVIVKKRVVCPRRPTRRVTCNRRTGIGREVRRYTVRVRCRCVRRVRVRRFRCIVCRPKVLVIKKPCPRRGYFRRIIIKTRRQRGLRCLWTTRVIRRRCRCRKGKTIRGCDRRGNKTVTVITIRLVGTRCKKTVRRRSTPVRCGRPRPKERVIIGRCNKATNRRVISFVRRVLKPLVCRCKTFVRKIVVPCRCPKPAIAKVRCFRHTRLQKLLVRYIRRGFRCIRQTRVLTKVIKCRTGVVTRLGPCLKNGKRIGLQWIFRALNCRCVKKVLRRVVLNCKCKTTVRKIKRCRGGKVLFIISRRQVRVGLTCKWRQTVSRRVIRCRGRRVSSTGCNRRNCKRIIVTRVNRAVNCKCKLVVVKRQPVTCCCLQKPMRRVMCVRNVKKVFERSWWVLRRGRCRRRVIRRSIIIRCTRRITRVRKICRGCNGQLIYYGRRVNNCRCVTRVVKRKAIKCCCPKRSAGVRCNRRTGIKTRFLIYYILSRGRCYRRVRNRSVRIRCAGVKVRATTCRGKRTRVVKTYYRRRVACRCYWKLVRRRREPCVCSKRLWKRKTRCIRSYRYISIYGKVLRVRRGRRVCVTVLVRRFRERCKCPKPMKIKRCVRHYRKVTITITYRLTRKSPKRCVKKVKKTDKPMGGCNLRPKVVRVIARRCNKRTRMRLIITVLKIARSCKCRRFRRTKRVVCACPKKRVARYCVRGAIKTTIIVSYRAIRRGYKVICLKRVKRISKVVSCKIGRVNKLGRCYRPRGKLSRRVILTFLFYRRNCRCYTRLIRKRIVPCECAKTRTRIMCRGNYKLVQVIMYRLIKHRCVRRIISERRNIKCKVGRVIVKTKCRRNRYIIKTIIRWLRNCKCKKRVYRRHCHCRCAPTRKVKRCTGRYYFLIITHYSIRRGCRCYRRRHLRRVAPKCTGRPGVRTTRCNRRRASGYKLVIITRRYRNSRRCLCSTKTTRRRVICYCRPNVRVLRRCHRHRYRIITVTRRVISRRLNRCVRRVVRRQTITVRCRGIRGVLKCTKSGILLRIVTRHYARSCACRKVRRVYRVGRCRCNVKPRKVVDRCNRRTCRRLRVFIHERLYRRRCLKIRRNVFTKCCCPSRRVRRYCNRARGLKVTRILTYRLLRGRCFPRVRHLYRRVRCKRVTKRSSKCVGVFKRIVIMIYVRRGCKCVWRVYRRITLRCKCNRPRFRSWCSRGRLYKWRMWYILRRGRCLPRVKTTSRKIKCGPRVTKRMTPCNKRTGINYLVMTWRYVTRICKCKKVVRRIPGACLCRPAKRVVRRCDPRRGHRITMVILRILNRRLRRCFTKVKTYRRAVVCRPSRWRRDRRRRRCIPLKPFGIRKRVYIRRVRVGCRCVLQRRIVRCHCRCRGPRLRRFCSRTGRHVIIDRFYYRYNGCRCRRIRRRTIKRVNCGRRRTIVSRCLRCRQTVTTIRPYVSRCRCRRIIRRRRRVCCCPKGIRKKRCDRRRGHIVIVTVRYRFVPYRCLRRVSVRRIPIRCSKRVKRTNPSRCIGRKYYVTLVYQVRRGCKCIVRKRRVARPCPCRRARTVVMRCNTRNCRQRLVYIYFILRRFRCIRYTRNSYRRCCCHRRLRVRVICRGNRRIRIVSWSVFIRRRRVCARKSRRIDITPKCGRPFTKRRVCRRNGVLIITKTWRYRVRCVCRVRVRRIVLRCKCPGRRRYKSCYKGRFRQVITISYRLIRGRCYRRRKRRLTLVVCKRRRTRVGRCNRFTCLKIIRTIWNVVRNCRCRTRVSVARVRCCCKITGTKRYVRCDPRRGRVIVTVTRYFNTKRRTCVKKVTRRILPVRCSRRVIKRGLRCKYRRGGRKYQIVIISKLRRVGCRCVRITRRKWRVCRCKRTKTVKRCVRGVIVVYRVGERLVIRRGLRRCVRFKRVIRRISRRCPSRVILPGTCRGRRRRYRIIRYRKVGCKCKALVRYGTAICRCPRQRVVRLCRRNVYITKIIRNVMICPRDRYGWMRCRCRKVIKTIKRRHRCPLPIVSASRCVRGRRRVKITVFRAFNCRCRAISEGRVRKCGLCQDFLSKRTCARYIRRGYCTRSRRVRKVCKKTCGLCAPCKNRKGVKKMRYVKKPGRGIKPDKRYKKRFLIKSVVVPNTPRGIRKCKKICNKMRLCKSFEVVTKKPRRPRPGKPGPGKPGKPGPGKPGKPGPGKPGKPGPGGRKPKKCTCHFSSITPKKLRKYVPRNKGTRAPKRTLYVKKCVKPCKKSIKVVKAYKCRCLKTKLRACYRVLVVTIQKRDKKMRCRKVRRYIKASCRMPCVNIKSRRYCRRAVRRGGCRRRAVRRVCNKSCMPRCRGCKGRITFYKKCKRVKGRWMTTRVRVYRRKVRGICTKIIRRKRFPCKPPCTRKAFIRIKVGRCIAGKRNVFTLRLVRYRGKRGGVHCRIKVTRRVYNCRGCCPSVVVRPTPCRRGRRVVRIIFWARIRNCCRRKVKINRHLCGRCPRDMVRRGPCRYGFQLIYKMWYHRSTVTGRCARHTIIRARRCSRRRP